MPDTPAPLPQLDAAGLVEAVAGALEPGTFARPKINLFKADYDAAYGKARAALAAVAQAAGVSALREAVDLLDGFAGLNPSLRPALLLLRALAAHAQPERKA